MYVLGGCWVIGCFNKLINFKRIVFYDYMFLIKIMDSSENIVKYFSFLKIIVKQFYMYICELYVLKIVLLNIIDSNQFIKFGKYLNDIL